MKASIPFQVMYMTHLLQLGPCFVPLNLMLIKWTENELIMHYAEIFCGID